MYKISYFQGVPGPVFFTLLTRFSFSGLFLLRGEQSIVVEGMASA